MLKIFPVVVLVVDDATWRWQLLKALAEGVVGHAKTVAFVLVKGLVARNDLFALSAPEIVRKRLKLIKLKVWSP